MRLEAPAKLNLFLHVVGRRSDGYHELQTLFQLIDLCDEVEVTLLREPGVVLSPGSDGPREGNLAVRAAQLLLERSQVSQGALIHLRKRIPQGGLGGGSSDAAAVLLGLNRLVGNPFDIVELALLGRELGADVPVFVHGRTAWAEGIGERLTPVQLPAAWYVLVAPGPEVSTAAVFGHPSLTRNSPLITIRDFLRQGARNDCEPLVRALYPAVNVAFEWLASRGNARLTGTGGCVFAQFRDPDEAARVAADVPREWASRWKVWVVKGIDRSPIAA